MLAAFIGESQLRDLHSLMGQDNLSSDQLMLLSPQIFDHFKNGRISLKGGFSKTTKDSVRPPAMITDIILIMVRLDTQ